LVHDNVFSPDGSENPSLFSEDCSEQLEIAPKNKKFKLIDGITR
jgi:hypothetical protein